MTRLFLKGTILLFAIATGSEAGVIRGVVTTGGNMAACILVTPNAAFELSELALR